MNFTALMAKSSVASAVYSASLCWVGHLPRMRKSGVTSKAAGMSTSVIRELQLASTGGVHDLDTRIGSEHFAAAV